MKIPQIIMVFIIGVRFCAQIVKEARMDQTSSNKYAGYLAAVIVALLHFGVLYWGGFFN